MQLNDEDERYKQFTAKRAKLGEWAPSVVIDLDPCMY
jgi:hypothetical protein